MIGDGNCLFRAVSHQLYGTQNYHYQVRAAGVQFMTNNPERFIESNTEDSWLQYITAMACDGCWADNLIIQALANVFLANIHITESDPNFSEYTYIYL